MGTIRISEYCFDEEFFISRHLTREELDGTLDYLLFLDVYHRESVTDGTLVFNISWKIEEKVSNRFNPSFSQFFDVRIRRAEE